MRGLGLEDKDFDYVKSTLAETLVEFKLTPAQVAKAAAVVESTREAVRRTEEPARLSAFATPAPIDLVWPTLCGACCLQVMGRTA